MPEDFGLDIEGTQVVWLGVRETMTHLINLNKDSQFLDLPYVIEEGHYII